jgi:flagellar basal-body rod protein FlgB
MKAVMPGNDPFLGRMERALDVMSRRQALLATNVGNLDTPRYDTLDIDFNAALERAVTESGSNPEGVVQRVRGLARRNDGNNVSLDREMMAIAETAGRFEQTTSILRHKLKQLLYAVSDGRSV